jgi:hypothetical protein
VPMETPMRELWPRRRWRLYWAGRRTHLRPGLVWWTGRRHVRMLRLPRKGA